MTYTKLLPDLVKSSLAAISLARAIQPPYPNIMMLMPNANITGEKLGTQQKTVKP